MLLKELVFAKISRSDCETASPRLISFSSGPSSYLGKDTGKGNPLYSESDTDYYSVESGSERDIQNHGLESEPETEFEDFPVYNEFQESLNLNQFSEVSEDNGSDSERIDSPCTVISEEHRDISAKQCVISEEHRDISAEQCVISEERHVKLEERCDISKERRYTNPINRSKVLQSEICEKSENLSIDSDTSEDNIESLKIDPLEEQIRQGEQKPVIEACDLETESFISETNTVYSHDYEDAIEDELTRLSNNTSEHCEYISDLEQLEESRQIEDTIQSSLETVENQGKHISEPEEDIGEPKKDITEPKKDIGEPKKDIGEPKKDISEPKKDNSEPKEDISEPKEDISEPEDIHSNPTPLREDNQGNLISHLTEDPDTDSSGSELDLPDGAGMSRMLGKKKRFSVSNESLNGEVVSLDPDHASDTLHSR